MLRIHALTLGVLATVAAPTWTVLQRPHAQYGMEREIRREFDARVEALEARIREFPDHDLAGEYRRGIDERHENYDRLRITPDASFVFERRGWGG